MKIETKAKMARALSLALDSSAGFTLGVTFAAGIVALDGGLEELGAPKWLRATIAGVEYIGSIACLKSFAYPVDWEIRKGVNKLFKIEWDELSRTYVSTKMPKVSMDEPKKEEEFKMGFQG